MKLILFRHGLAVEHDDYIKTNQDDSLRPLVLKGKRRTMTMAKHLQSRIGSVDMIVSSPYVRAKQTAEILKRVLQPKKYFECVELIPSAPPMAFASWLRANAALATKIIVVGHAPQLNTFASWSLSGQLENFIDIKKSGMLGLEIENFQNYVSGQAELKFLLSYSLLI